MTISILEFDKAIANMYPCKRDTITNNVYRDCKGITDIIPTIKWAIIARFHFNVHSIVPVPCSFGLTCSLTRVVLVVYDLDAEELIYTNYDPNYTFYLAANKLGYVVVAHGHTDSQVTKIKNNQIPWRLRILGKSKEDLPHECTLMRTGKCDHNEEQNYNLNIDVVSEYYVPNNKNLIGRFIIEIAETMLVTLLVKLSNDKVNFLVTLTGEDDEILAEVSGVGQVMLPAVLLLQSLGIKNEDTSTYIFYGSMTLLYHSWPLSPEEQNFIEELQSNEGAKPSLDLTDPDVKIFGAYWCISMFYDEMEEPPAIFPDRGLMDKFYVGLKLSVEEDPERVMRGRVLREEYLKEFVGIMNEPVFDEYILLPSKENSNITEVLLQKYANEDEHLFPCIFDEVTQEKLHQALAEGRERL
uniref:Androglobin domain-containing protein n=1 Tax=Rhodnius prolixus TaxID=13249 RepID=T1HF51_RHOPR